MLCLPLRCVLVRSVPDPDRPSHSLHLAASKGALDSARVLLSYGADPLLEETRGARRTPLKIARDFKHREVAALISSTIEDLLEHR